MIKALFISLLTATLAHAQGYDARTADYLRAWRIGAAANQFVQATGGDSVVNYFDTNGVAWTAHIFTTVGTNSLNVTRGGEVEYLVVAGGGGGGSGADAGGQRAGGAGGAGGLLQVETTLDSGTYSILVGAGGAKASSIQLRGSSGGNSAFGDTVALGGGGGGGFNTPTGISGGSGGGAGGAGVTTHMGGTGTAGQGFSGGRRLLEDANIGGGGGGAGGPGPDNTARAPGPGLDLSAKYTTSLGVDGVFARGGGHATGDGPENSGFGGGGSVQVGSSITSGNGGSGIVVIRYRANIDPVWNGLLAYWSMDSVSGTTVFDTWGSNNGTAVGTPLFGAAYGVSGDGVNLNGSSQIITHAPVVSRTSTTYSVSGWVRFDSTAGNYVFFDSTQSGGTISFVYRALYLNGSDSFLFQVRGADNTTRSATISRGSITTGQYFHLAGIRSGNTLDIWVNGQKGTTSTGAIGTLADVTYTATIGALRNSINPNGDGFHDGQMDEIAIFNRALSSNEVSEIYNNGKGRFYKP